MPFQLLEHTADVGVRATGPDLSAAIADAVRGLFAILAPDARSIGSGQQRRLTVESPTVERLVVDVLDDVNYLHQSERFLASAVEVGLHAGLEGVTARITLQGEQYDPKRHGHLMEVKATTFHGLVVEESPPRIEVIFDI